MRKLIRECDALPTGLPGPHSVSTRLDRVSHATGGLLAEPKVFEAISGWTRFATTHGCGSIVTGEISLALQRLTGREIPEIGLADVVQVELSGKGIHAAADTDLASQLGSVITVSFLQENRTGAEKDRKALEAFLAKVNFRSSDGQWQQAGELLIADEGLDHVDESDRAAFAPSRYVLHPGYDTLGREFVRAACRPAQRMNCAGRANDEMGLGGR